MFKWINKQGVESSEGFEVQFTGRYTAEYREGVKYLVVDVESNANGLIDFDPKAFAKWLIRRMPNSPTDQARMLKTFIDALAFQGLTASS